MSKNQIKPTGRRNDIVIQELGSEILIYDLLVHKAFHLNETSALVWQACDGSRTVCEISEQISRRLDSPVGEDFVWFALGQLKRENLIENEAGAFTPPAGPARREVIRRIGLTTLAALPLISSLVAPPAAYSQSGCGAPSGKPNGCACTAAGNCSSNCCGASPSGNRCSAPGADPVGSVCRANCECASNCCGFGFTCAASGSMPPGGFCRVNCECTSGACSSGVCAP